MIIMIMIIITVYRRNIAQEINHFRANNMNEVLRAMRVRETYFYIVATLILVVLILMLVVLILIWLK